MGKPLVARTAQKTRPARVSQGCVGQIPDRALAVVQRDAQKFSVEESDLTELTLYLKDDFVNCDQPVAVAWKGREVYSGTPKRTIATLGETLRRGDPKGVYFAKITFNNPEESVTK